MPPIKRDTVVKLEQKISRLQIQLDNFKAKYLKLEIKTLEQKRTIARLKLELDELKRIKQPVPTVNIKAIQKLMGNAKPD